MTTNEQRTGVNEVPNQPELADLFRTQLREAALQLKSHSVARVVASSTHPTGYNPATQTCSLSVDVLQVIKDHFTPATPAAPNPVKVQTPVLLQNIKVAWPRTSTGYLTFPLAINDTGELHVQDRSIDRWRQTALPSDPVSSFVHVLADSVFHPNITPDGAAIVPPTSLLATVLQGPLILFGPAATQPLVNGLGFGTPMAAYVDALNAASVIWDASLKDPAATVVFLNAQSVANKILFATIAGWLSAKTFTE